MYTKNGAPIIEVSTPIGSVLGAIAVLQTRSISMRNSAPTTTTTGHSLTWSGPARALHT